MTVIGNYSFAWCSSLQSITLPDNVTTIDHQAFKECLSLASITIPVSVTTIGSNVFARSDRNTELTVTYLGTQEQWNAINKSSYWRDDAPYSMSIVFASPQP